MVRPSGWCEQAEVTIRPFTHARDRWAPQLARLSFRASGRVLSATACAICGTHVRRGDAIGLVAGRVTHAECALVHWLGAAAEQPDVDSGLAAWMSRERAADPDVRAGEFAPQTLGEARSRFPPTLRSKFTKEGAKPVPPDPAE
jgi:hypothetical protein